MRWIADLLYILAGMIYLPIVAYQAIFQGKNRRGWAQRFSRVKRRDGRPRIWIHAVSLGEINVTPRLVEALRELLPQHDIVLSTTTDTGFARAVQLYGRDNVFRFPLDFSLVIAAALRRVRPSLLIMVELEVWYNLTRMAGARGIPIAVVNGRLTERSAHRLRLLGPFCRQMFRELTWVGAQDEAIAARFGSVGTIAERVEITGSMKWDSAAVASNVDGTDLLRCALGIDENRRLWVCGSTGPGEEAVILEAYERLMRVSAELEHDLQAGQQQSLCPTLAIVPRKPERFDEVARLIERAGFACVRRSESPDGATRPRSDGATEAVVLGDTMGELRKFYSLADVVFVGRSLVPMGGSDPMEVAALGKPIVVGPHMDNFQMPVAALRDADAIRVVQSAESLAKTIGELLQDSDSAQRMGARARDVVLANQGATQRTADAVARLARTAHEG